MRCPSRKGLEDVADKERPSLVDFLFLLLLIVVKVVVVVLLVLTLVLLPLVVLCWLLVVRRAF